MNIPELSIRQWRECIECTFCNKDNLFCSFYDTYTYIERGGGDACYEHFTRDEMQEIMDKHNEKEIECNKE